MSAAASCHLYRRSLGLVLLAFSLASGSAYAQTAQAPSGALTPSAPGTMPPSAPEHYTDWANEKFERQEFREEMEKIRREHEDLETARDKLLDQCVNAAGPKIVDCEREKQELHDWHDRLHDRMRALHEKMEATHRDHPDSLMNMAPGDNRTWPHALPPPPATVTGSPFDQQAQPPVPSSPPPAPTSNLPPNQLPPAR